MKDRWALGWVVGLLSLLIAVAVADGERQDLVAPGAQIEKRAGGFVFTEGPACDRDGNVYFSDIPNNRIHKWSVDGRLSTVRENSGGANGLYIDAGGNLLACEGGSRRLTSMASDGTISVLADHYAGKKLNSPNDLWIDPQGGIYFTDPRYGGQDDLEQGGCHVYYLPPTGKELVRVIDDMTKPNGIIGTADGKRLYVADTVDNCILEYRIQAGGLLSGRKLFAPQGSDGMAIDENGNVYLTRHDHVTVYSPQGKKLAALKIPEGPCNVCFGGKDRKTLFVTAHKGLYTIRMNVRGQLERRAGVPKRDKE